MNTGTVTFQANDKTDVFHVTAIKESGIEQSDEAFMLIEDSQFESDKAWVNGNVPTIKPVHVEGDTSIINAWFKGEVFESAFVIIVYVECETAEELEAVISDNELKNIANPEDDWLAPMEINL